MIWVPPLWRLPRNTYPVAYLKHPEPGAWQRAADEMQAAVLRTYRNAQNYVSAAIAVRLAADFGERGASERPSKDDYRHGVIACLLSLTEATVDTAVNARPKMINPRRG